MMLVSMVVVVVVGAGVDGARVMGDRVVLGAIVAGAGVVGARVVTGARLVGARVDVGGEVAATAVAATTALPLSIAESNRSVLRHVRRLFSSPSLGMVRYRTGLSCRKLSCQTADSRRYTPRTLASTGTPLSPIHVVGKSAGFVSGHCSSFLRVGDVPLPEVFDVATIRNGTVHEWYTEKHDPAGSVQPTAVQLPVVGPQASPILSVMGLAKCSEQRSQDTSGMSIVNEYSVYVDSLPSTGGAGGFSPCGM
jgi:hypothetical protein